MGACRGVLVGLFLERSIEMIVGILGILKTGAAYVPIDSTFPIDRTTFILKDAGVKLIVTQSSLAEKLPLNELQPLYMDGLKWRHEGTTAFSRSICTPNDLAYVIYTSGSTGRPKGVAIEHRNIINYVRGISERLRFESGMHHAMVSTIAADLGNTVLFPALATGGCLHVISEERTKSQEGLSDYFDRQKIDVLKIVPSHLAALQAGKRPERVMPRKRLILGGEASRIDWIRDLRHMTNGCEIYNHYGPTETTVGVLTYQVGQELPSTRSGSLPLGKPLPGSRVYILDESGEPVVAGSEGEIYIAGQGVARGYLNRPELNSERFLPDRFSEDLKERMYRTGDLARQLPDGNIEFCGRIDDQVKIHGYRIELGEIECALREIPGVRDSLVLAREDSSGAKGLVAYVVPERKDQPLWDAKNVHVLPDGLQVALINPKETEAIYKRLFIDRAYCWQGIWVRDGDHIIDLGAGIGLFASFACRFANHVRILCLEADPATFACLRVNAEAWGGGISYLRLDVVHETAEEEFFRALSQPSSPAHEESKRPNTLHGIIAGKYFERVDLLRVHGTKAELDGLKQLTSQDWASIGQVVIEAHSGDDARSMEALLRRQNFAVVIKDSTSSLDAPFYVYGKRTSASSSRPVENSIGNPDARPLRMPHPGVLSPAFLRKRLRERLLHQMVPAAFMLLDQFPLTANGKIDRLALPAVTHEVVQHVRGFAPPRDSTEKILAEIWADLLNVERVGIEDDFFELGGHSLLAIRAVSRIRDAFGADLPLATLLHTPTIAQLAEVLRKERSVPSWDLLVPLRASGTKPPLFLMHAHGGNVLEYQALAKLLDTDQPVYAVQARGLDGNVRTELTIEQLASEYLVEMRTLQPEGPYFLAGFCFGGLVAFEIAQQLRQAGEEVALLALIQSTHPAVFHRFMPGVSVLRRWWYRLQKQFDLERENRLHGGKGYLWRRFRFVVDVLLVRLAARLSSRLGKHPLTGAHMPKLFIYERLKVEHLKAVTRYTPRPYAGESVLFRASKQLRGILADESLGWKETLLGHRKICEVTGHQQNLMLEPNVQSLARELNDHLRAAHRRCVSIEG
jgi:amino acid adenylation domain-containing protein